MTNIIELEVAIKRAQITKKELAHQIGISTQALYNKLNNSAEFKASEIAKTCDLLNLDRKDRDKIFFAQNVDN